jgi:ABC-type sugar transport system permease subunit
LLILWRVVFGVMAILAAIAPWLGLVILDLTNAIQISISTVLVIVGIASLLSAFDMYNGKHRGRVISLVVDYIGFLVCAVYLMQIGGVFTGIDIVAEVFGRGLFFLGISFIGYLLMLASEQYASKPATQKNLKTAAKWVIYIGIGLFLIALNVHLSILTFVTKIATPAGMAVSLCATAFALALWAAWRAPTATILNARTNYEQALNGWLFLSPNLIGFLIFFAGPLLLSFYFSFTDSDAFNTPNWVGLDNYAKIFNIRFALLTSPDQLAKEVVDIKVYDEVGRLTARNGGILFAAADKFFWLALKNTLTFALFAVPLSVIPALFLANALNGKLPGMKIFRAIYFIPSIAAIVGISLVWQWLYNATIGYINYFITTGIEFLNMLFSASIVDPKIQWVSDEKTALLAIIIISAWQTMGFNTVLFLAGLQNIPGELYEAATVDGAGSWAKFRHITIPMLAPTTFFVVTTTTIQAMQVFEQIFILMNPPEGPNNSTISLVLYLYRSGFQNFKQGYASALAWVLFIVIFGVTLIQFRQQRRSSIYEN